MTLSTILRALIATCATCTAHAGAITSVSLNYDWTSWSLTGTGVTLGLISQRTTIGNSGGNSSDKTYYSRNLQQSGWSSGNLHDELSGGGDLAITDGFARSDALGVTVLAEANNHYAWAGGHSYREGTWLVTGTGYVTAQINYTATSSIYTASSLDSGWLDYWLMLQLKNSAANNQVSFDRHALTRRMDGDTFNDTQNGTFGVILPVFDGEIIDVWVGAVASANALPDSPNPYNTSEGGTTALFLLISVGAAGVVMRKEPMGSVQFAAVRR